MAKAKKAAVKKTGAKKTGTAPVEATGPVDNVQVRMYCLGTGDCFVLRFCAGDKPRFTMMIDCGSCRGEAKDFRPYLEDLQTYVGKQIDLLVVTHEHNDHVNGFAKCADIFKDITIREAWFAWTEDPDDPSGAAQELRNKRSKMKHAFGNAFNAVSQNVKKLKHSKSNEFYTKSFLQSSEGYLRGLNTLADINLPDEGDSKNPLPGMKKIKELLKEKEVKPKYLSPGETVRAAGAEGVVFHVLGPPTVGKYIFKDGRQGVDVYDKKLQLNQSALAANAFINMDTVTESDIPFPGRYAVNPEKPKNATPETLAVMESYQARANSWRSIDDDWLNAAGSLALRLNSHINNTSLALAIEFEGSKKVLLFPGDAEYGSWESWHEIEKWKPQKPGEKHFVEDLLNRTVFYKVGHHLSYNGTALQKGIMMMESQQLASMATLDRTRIATGWKSTMPNKYLMEELTKRCGGKLFIMDEFEIEEGPSRQLNKRELGEDYKVGKSSEGTVLYKQYRVHI